MVEPGGETTVSLTLMNAGRDDTFRINVTVDTDASDDEASFFNYITTPSVVSVGQNMTANIAVKISLNHNAPMGFSVTFTLVAQSVSDIDVNDYITFDVTNTLTEQMNPIVSSRVLIVGEYYEMLLHTIGWFS